jgi:hypothetical protein
MKTQTLIQGALAALGLGLVVTAADAARPPMEKGSDLSVEPLSKSQVDRSYAGVAASGKTGAAVTRPLKSSHWWLA